MEKMFGTMMEGFMKGMSEEAKKRMAAMCPCMTGKEMTDAEKKAMAERMTACCGGVKEMMSTDQRVTCGFFKKMGSQAEGADKPEKA